ncbi:hypothetical protein WJX74_005612 [Apatococcus lobatus]|uniref:Uncharacterized protein n=1 Tax=Apatococcus lobatus TaxID=904363 RepID=A0AAW1S304_9CHLO
MHNLMDPEMMRLAMEQMKKMTPEQMAQMSQQAASMSPDLLQQGMNRFNAMSGSERQQATQKMKDLNPSDYSSMAGQATAHLSAQQKHALQAANQLKTEGNGHHSAKDFHRAADCYNRAKSALAGQTNAEALDLLKACSSNLSSCYLNTQQHSRCIDECDQLITRDPQNRKALYRRGQSLANSGRPGQAVVDLQRALDLSPENEKSVIAEKLAAARQMQQSQAANEPIVEEPLDEEDGDDSHAAAAAEPMADLHPAPGSRPAPDEREVPKQEAEPAFDANPASMRSAPATSAPVPAASSSQEWPPSMPSFPGMAAARGTPDMAEISQAMRTNPGMMRQMGESLANMSQEQLDSMTAMSGMPGAAGMKMTPEMIKMATSMMSSMTPEDMQRMAAMAPNMSQRDAASSQSASAAGAGSAPAASRAGVPSQQQMPQMDMADLQARMKDPATMEMMSSMMKNMKAEDLASIASASGMNISTSQAEMMKTQMDKLTPGQMQMMMRGASWLQTFIAWYKRVMQYFTNYTFLIIALAVLLLALTLRLLKIL